MTQENGGSQHYGVGVVAFMALESFTACWNSVKTLANRDRLETMGLWLIGMLVFLWGRASPPLAANGGWTG